MRTLQTRIKLLGAILGLTIVSSQVFAMGAGHYERDGKTLRSSRKLTSETRTYGNFYRSNASTTTAASDQVYDPVSGKMRPQITPTQMADLKNTAKFGPYITAEQLANLKKSIVPESTTTEVEQCKKEEAEAKNAKLCPYLMQTRYTTQKDGTDRQECYWNTTEDQVKYGAVSAACGIGEKGCSWNGDTCKQARREAGLGACEAQAKEATTAYNDFRKACDETKIGSPEQCLEEARQCTLGWQAAEETDEDEEAEDGFSMSALWEKFGLGKEDEKVTSKTKVCSILGRKDWNTEKKNIDSAIADAKKEMTELKKDLDKDIREFTDKKAEIMKSFNDAQVATREKMSEAQEAATQKGMEAQERIMEAEENKATLGAQILKMYGEKSNLISQRAQLMAIKSDAMIAETCERTVELERAKMASGLQAGQQAYMMSRARKHKFLLELRKSCISQAQIERAGQWRDLNNKISQVDNEVANLNRKSALADSTVDSTQRQNQADIQKAAQVQQSLSTEGTSEQSNITVQMQELQANQTQRIQNAAEETKAANDKISALNDEMTALGKRPKGEKAPTEAASKFSEFANKVKALAATDSCKERADEVVKNTVETDKVKVFYEKGTNFSDEEDEEADDEGAVK